jgi:hypothetical protein
VLRRKKSAQYWQIAEKKILRAEVRTPRHLLLSRCRLARMPSSGAAQNATPVEALWERLVTVSDTARSFSRAGRGIKFVQLLQSQCDAIGKLQLPALS